ncbi:hypothetical protein [Butyricimonas hominis]|jgi:lipoprotein|uniref:Uncharacterized protein n=1 Tax=Butyricimonas hominis TaxID=2763032 RepID=A0ABR7D0C2_9BACT|nr:hypothetical protein [Butyricimonas hominis]MBC5621376.1 hypothetical protein [Butyricimonas hominis]
MKKSIGYFLWVSFIFMLFGCAELYKGDEDEQVEVILPPGPTYTTETEHTLNVVYYVPADEYDREYWHWRLSGFALDMQKYFELCLQRNRIPNKKFGLIVNENPDYVKMHYIKSSLPTDQMIEKNMPKMAEEVLAYFEQHPEEKTSDNYLVFMPKYTGSFCAHYSLGTYSGIAFCGVDHEKFKVRYLTSSRGREAHLASYGEVLHTLARSFGVPLESHKMSSATFSLVGAVKSKAVSKIYRWEWFYTRYCSNSGNTLNLPKGGILDKVILPEAAARFLEKHPLFSNVAPVEPEPLEVTIDEWDIRSLPGNPALEEDSVFVACTFHSNKPVDGIILYNDPWASHDVTVSYEPINAASYAAYQAASEALERNETWDGGNDAYGVYKNILYAEDLGNNTYRVTFDIAMGDLFLNKPFFGTWSKSFGAELRFRFIGKDGSRCPSYPSVKGSLTCETGGDYRRLYRLSYTASNSPITHNIATLYGTKE